MIIDYGKETSLQRYKLMAQTIIPRPIAWIVTQNSEGCINIAPFSYFMGLSSNPPTMVVSIGHKSDGTPKDTLHNIRQTQKCTICMVEPKDMEQMHFSSKELDAHTSEASLFHIQTRKIVDGFPPIVHNTPSAFFCTLYQEIALQDSKTIPLIVEIDSQYIANRVLTDKEKLQWEYEPLARIGKTYALLGEKLTPPSIP
jgi:flavin reductase (DIM6/NTAB) family NADH-FMN oxidoreductase RutF